MNYSVNDDTLAIIPNGKNKSNILESQKYFENNNPTKKVIEDSCEYFGVSYNSRVRGSMNIINSRYKTPIIIKDSSRMIFFPVSSPIRTNSLWVSFNNIKDYYPKRNKKKTIIIFKNGYKLEINVSFYSFNQQYLKASKLNSILSIRNMEK